MLEKSHIDKIVGKLQPWNLMNTVEIEQAITDLAELVFDAEQLHDES